MKKLVLKSLAASVLLASSLGVAHAATMNKQQLQAFIEKVVNQRTAKLQKQVSQLQQQVVLLKGQLRSKPRVIPVATGPLAIHTLPKSEIPPITGFNANQPTNPRYTPIPMKSPHQAQAEMVLDAIHLGGTPVFTSPYIGVHSAYDGSDLIVNAPSVNLDTRLLKQLQAMHELLDKHHMPRARHPVIILSGDIEGQGLVTKSSPGNTQSDINLTGASLDFLAHINPMVTGFLSVHYDDSQTSPYRVANSNIDLDQGFITFGNLQRSHLYATLGQIYVPFGQYSSYMISAPMTEAVGRVKGRAFVLGVYPQRETGIYAASYVFRGDTTGNKSTNAGVNLGVKTITGQLHSNVAVGAISNIADAEGMQANGAPASIPFAGFSMSARAENIFHAVPGLNAHGEFDYQHLSLLAEYVAATRSFDRRAMTFNGHGARPQAVHVEGIYHFELHNRPGSIGLGYGWTNEALALLLPHQRYLAVINYAFWRDTLASLEFRHDIDYSSADTASGANLAAFSPLHKYVNMVTAQFAIYF